MIIQKIEAGIPLRDVDISWAAGFWDGEGSFMRDKRTEVVTLQITQAGDEGEALLTRFAKSLGVSGTIYEGFRKYEHHKLCYKIHFWGEQAVIAYNLCKPYLSETKKAQAEVLIDAWRLKQSKYIHHESKKTHCLRGHEFSPENTRINTSGARVCKTCRRATGLKAYYKKKAARVEVHQEQDANVQDVVDLLSDSPNNGEILDR